MFSDNRSYCQSIANAQANLDAAKETLKETQDSIEFFKTLLKDNF